MAGAKQRIFAIALDSSDVPTLRRGAFYRPQPLAALHASTGMRGGVPPGRTSEPEAPAQYVAELVRWVARWGVVGIDGLALHLGVDEAQVLERVARAKREQLVGCAMILRGEGLLCWATRRGKRAAGLSYLPTCAVNYCSVRRRATTARIAALLEREHPDHQVVGVPELEARQRLSAPSVPARLASVASALPSAHPRGGHRSPAILITREGDCESRPIAALLQLGGIREARLNAILRAWAGLEPLRSVIVYVELSRVRRAAANALGDLEAGGRVCLRPLPRVIPRPL
jgi:hypothetical protein